MIPNNELERRLVEISNNSHHGIEFYNTLLESDIYFLSQNHQQTSNQITIKQIEIENNVYIPFFSSIERIKDVIADDAAYGKLNARDFFNVLARGDNSNSLVLNPGSDYGKYFTATEINLLAEGKNLATAEEINMAAGEQLLLGQPSKYPQQLVECLNENFNAMKEVQKAYLVLMQNVPVDEQPHTLIVIDAIGDFEVLANKVIGMIDQVKNIPDPPVDITRFSENPSDEISNYCQEIKPFYQK